MAAAKTKPISRCPKCKALLQATLKVDLSRVAVHEGQIVSFKVDGIDDDSHDQIERLIDQAGTFGSELRVYCENDGWNRDSQTNTRIDCTACFCIHYTSREQNEYGITHGYGPCRIVM